MILPVAINDIISRIEGIHKIPSVGKKSFGRTYGIEIKKVTMDMFIYYHIKSPNILMNCTYCNIIEQQQKYNVNLIMK